MTLRTLGEFLKSPWTYIGLFALAALAGVIYLNSRIPCVAPQAAPTTPIPYIVNYAKLENPEERMPKDEMAAALIREFIEAGMADREFLIGKFGGSIRLRGADQTIRIPANVMVETFDALVTCADPYYCPRTPTYTLSKGKATIMIDDDGIVWPGVRETDDLDSFPFLACQNVKRVEMP